MISPGVVSDCGGQDRAHQLCSRKKAIEEKNKDLLMKREKYRTGFTLCFFYSHRLHLFFLLFVFVVVLVEGAEVSVTLAFCRTGLQMGFMAFKWGLLVMFSSVLDRKRLVWPPA